MYGCDVCTCVCDVCTCVCVTYIHDADDMCVCVCTCRSQRKVLDVLYHSLICSF